MKRIIQKVSAIILSGSILFCAGCNETSEKKPPAVSVVRVPEESEPSVPESSAASSSQSSESSAAVASSAVSTESTASSKPQSGPHFSFSHDPALEIPAGSAFKICSLSEALASFDDISHTNPVGTPEQVVKTLLERNILCFAAMQGKCWTYGEASGTDPLIVPLYSSYISSVDQMTDLFYGTYTENQAWRLFHPQDIDDYGNLCYGDVFRYDENGALCFDLDHQRKNHMESFATETYAAVISSSDTEITFGRYYGSTPSGGAEPNNMHFKAVKEYGEWRLDTYITDAPGFEQKYTELIPTGRVGAPELMELAKAQVGNIGGRKYWEWYGFGYHIEWCGAFVSWCYAQAGKNGPFFTACNSEGAAWFKERDQWGDKDYPDIAPGDSIFFDWDLDGSADHVGLVLGTDGEYVYTIEGNRDDICITRGYSRSGYAWILGYGLMDWSDI